MPKEQKPSPSKSNARRGPAPSAAADVIIGVVLEILESDGYEAVQLREVARLARVSLTTAYKLFGSRETLIAAAVERWMTDNCYKELIPPAAHETLYDGLMRILHTVFEPWERNPRMLDAHYRASNEPNGRQLAERTWEVIGPVTREVFAGADPEYIEDLERIMTDMSYGLVGRFSAGTIDVTDILPALERVVFRMTTDNAGPAAAALVHRRAAPDPDPD